MFKTKIAAMAVIALSVAACGVYKLNQSEQAAVELGALKYAQAAGGTFLSCSGQDSDGNGYVTCSVKDNANSVKELLCSYGSPGCKSK